MKRPDSVKITKIVSHNLTVLREKHGYSMAELAKKCGCTRMTIYNLESGAHLPTPKLSEALAKALKVEEHQIYQYNASF